MTDHTFPVTGPILLTGRIGHGSFTVHERDGITEATVALTPHGKAAAQLIERAAVELRGQTLVVELPRQGGIFDLPLFGGRGRDGVAVTVTVPSGTAVTISSFTAPVTVDGRSGPADIGTGSADVVLDHVDGDLRLRFGSGSGRVECVSGSVQARTGSGDLVLGEVGGSLTSACGSGRLDVGEARGPVRFRTGSGGVLLRAVHADVDLASGSGELAVGLPAGQPARVEVTTGSGRVATELPIEDAPAGRGTPITVRARTGSGDVRLFRAA